MADLYTTATGLAGDYATIGGNAKKVLGDGSAGVGPYTSFGTPKLQGLKIISSAYNFTTTPTVVDSNLSKAVRALQGLSEIYYVGVPTATGANQFIALVNLNNTDTGALYGATSGQPDTSYTNLEAVILAALGGSGSVTITNSTLTGLTFS
jgi:hypothetical protein